MAKITTATSEKIFQIKKWGGLHESPDGDTKLKMGEAAVTQNWRVTRDGNLQRRPGFRQLKKLGSVKIAGLWSGFVGKQEQLLAACNGHVYRLWDGSTGEFYSSPVDIGNISTANDVHFFGFADKVYMLNGSQYKVWDGTTLSDVVGYVPLVCVSIEPSPNSGMGGETLEQVNKLTGKRRVWLSPDGTGTTFYLPEKGFETGTGKITVTNLGTSTAITSGWSVDASAGTISFTAAPAQAVNGIEVQYEMSTNFAGSVKAMRYSELFSGMTDSRVFLYGDGTNEIFYSGVDYLGVARADYFPDLNVAAIGDANTPVTGLIRHYSQLTIFKSNSTWSASFSITTLPDGSSTEALRIVPVNKTIGNSAPGQMALVLNSPRTLFGSDVYEWKNNNSYSANLSVDERQAKRISDRIYASIQSFDLKSCRCYDDNFAQEYWVCHNGKALVHNYAVDAWYYYTNIYANCFCSFHKTLYFGDASGVVQYFDESYNTDNGQTIDSYWESGSMDFGQDYMRKYSAMTWLGIKPVSAGEVTVTVRTDRRPVGTERIVVSKLATLADVDFGNWSFNTNQQPHIKRLKIKAKKFVYYKLILKNETPNTSATVTSADIKVRYTGSAK